MSDFLISLKRNFLSPIVIAIFILSVILLFLGETRDAWFISSIVLLNTVLAIIQEARARYELKKLELMSTPHARRYKSDGSEQEVKFDELVIDDLILLQLGDEIPADGIIINSAGLEADESILTGESAPVEKLNQSMVYAASAVVAGSAKMSVTAVGANTKAGQMATLLKRYSPEVTPIQHSIARAITYLTYGALGLAVLIFVVYYLSGQEAVKIFKAITSGAITVVPEGLLLASTLLLAYGSIKLTQAKVLPQKLSAIEAMALIDVLCVDKTGTLTSDKIVFDQLEKFGSKNTPIAELAGIVAAETSGGSKTGLVISKALPAPDHYKIIQNLAFSSKRKFSGVRTTYNGKIYSVLMGAPEYLEKYATLSKSQLSRISESTNAGKRVLVVVLIDNIDLSLNDLPEKSGRPVAIITLTNELREGVHDTVSYLQNNGVCIKVISGDNADTVRFVADQAGIKNCSSVMTGFELNKINDSDWDRVVSGVTIFARILPEQKERLVDTFKRLGGYTGMIGDGINDALAIKKSDLGVAMYEGASATRRVADIVLLNNSFNSLPIGMKLGNRIMQAIEIIATLFFHKITYGVVLLLSTLALGIVYPFQPRHITFMNMFLVSMPTLMWTIFVPRPNHRVNPKYFWKDTLLAVMPIAALSGFVVSVAYTYLNIIHPGADQGVATTTVIIATFFGIYLVLLVPKMFNIISDRDASLARILYILSVIFVLSISFGVGFIRDFFDFTAPAWQNTLPLLALIVFVAVIQWKIAKAAGNRIINRIKN